MIKPGYIYTLYRLQFVEITGVFSELRTPLLKSVTNNFGFSMENHLFHLCLEEVLPLSCPHD